MIKASSYISPAALHIFFRYSFPSSFSLPFSPSPLFHLLFHGTLWFANLGNSWGKRGSSFSLPFASSPLFHLLFHGTLWFANFDNSWGKRGFFCIFYYTYSCFLDAASLRGRRGRYARTPSGSCARFYYILRGFTDE